MFELICNVLLFVFLGYTYFTHVLEARVPKAYLKNPNVLYPSTWPKLIIILLLVCIAINIYKILKKNKGNPEFSFAAFGKNSLVFLKSKTFLGMVILFAAAMVLEPLGFVVTAALLMFCYGMLLGEKKWWRLDLIAIGLGIVLHIVLIPIIVLALKRARLIPNE